MYRYEAAFGAADITSAAQRDALRQWYGLYYDQTPTAQHDPCQRIAYTVVGKLVRSVFGEYAMAAPDDFGKAVAAGLDDIKEQAMQLAMVGGECYLKPCPTQAGFSITCVDRSRMLIFGRDADGMPTDVGITEQTALGKHVYTLLERRRLDEQGLLTIENKLFRSRNGQSLGEQVALKTLPRYAGLPARYTFRAPLGLGLARLKMPMLNCVDGSAEGVSIYAAAAGLIRCVDENEAQLTGEFRNGRSRLVVSADMLREGQLQDELFVGLDEDPDRVGVHIFSPQLREGSYLARKQEYLRNIESLIGLKRGMLSDANLDERTATEISASSGEFNLTVISLQRAWQQAARQAMQICAQLAEELGMAAGSTEFSIDWGNGTLYDEDKRWQSYLQMVQLGLLKPEIALGWRFDLPASTPQQLQHIRETLMPVPTGGTE